MRKLLFVEDDADARAIVSAALSARGFECIGAASFEEGFLLLESNTVDGILLDFYVGEQTALQHIESFAIKSPSSSIIILTGHGTINLAVECMERGASYFVTKDTELARLAEIVSEKVSSPRVPQAGAPNSEQSHIQPMQRARESFEKDYLVRLLTISRGNLSEAARLSGRVRSDIYRLIGKYQIQQSEFRELATL